jgi:DNA-binding NarL/FixJ family response regulator
MSISVMLVDDSPSFIDGLILYLSTDPNLRVVGQANDGDSALKMIGASSLPEVVVMDYAMPGMDGVETAKHILASYPNIRIIILSVHDNKAYVTNAIFSGVRGYVLKDQSTEDLIKAIQAVHMNRFYFSPTLANKYFEQEG